MALHVLAKQEYVAACPEIGVAYRDIIGRRFPAMTVVQAAGLVEDEARVEIMAAAPD